MCPLCIRVGDPDRGTEMSVVLFVLSLVWVTWLAVATVIWLMDNNEGDADD